jgi:DNA-binding MarR family transcriptional regulator
MLIQNPAREVQQTVVDTFWETVPPVWNQVRNNLRQIVAAQFDITVEQFHVLRQIRTGARTMSELAETRRISRPAVSQAADGLVQKGLITRLENSADRRSVLLHLTPAGQELIAAIFAQNRAWMLEQLAGLSLEEAQSINRALCLLAQLFES